MEAAAGAIRRRPVARVIVANVEREPAARARLQSQARRGPAARTACRTAAVATAAGHHARDRPVGAHDPQRSGLGVALVRPGRRVADLELRDSRHGDRRCGGVVIDSVPLDRTPASTALSAVTIRRRCLPCFVALSTRSAGEWNTFVGDLKPFFSSSFTCVSVRVDVSATAVEVEANASNAKIRTVTTLAPGGSARLAVAGVGEDDPTRRKSSRSSSVTRHSEQCVPRSRSRPCSISRRSVPGANARACG